jgi:phosphonate transport system permease protein
MVDNDSRISVSDLTVEFTEGNQTVYALNGISLTVEPGENVAVIGPSGSGKSTLVRVLAGLVAPTSGEVRIGDQVVGTELDRQFYGDTGVVFQNHGLVPQLSAIENVLCGRLYDYTDTSLQGFDSEHRAAGVRALRQLGLGDRLNLPASQLSGGEKQRVALARLMLQDPSVALLDEPVSDLDVHWAESTIDVLEELGDKTSTVMVVHDLDLAEQWADRVIYLRGGQIAGDGEPSAICDQFRTLDHGDQQSDFESPSGQSPDSGSCPDGLDTMSTPSTVASAGSWGLAKWGYYGAVFATIIGLYVWAAWGVDLSFSRIFGNVGSAADFIGRMFPPDLSTDVTEPVWDSLVETVQMALIGTTMAACLSIPLSIMAARNISPRPVRAIARVILNGLRTVPSIIWGLFFVAIVGLGPLPGILALTFYASGYLGKFYYEAIEEIDPKPLRALKTVGAGPLQRFRFGVWPQVLPLFLGYTLYMFEYNIRSASVLGIVGAGGIGFYLYTYINNFNYPKATTALIALLIVVTIIDFASSRLRRWIAVE